MFNLRSTSPFALAALLFCSSSSASRSVDRPDLDRRQTPRGNDTTYLEPVVPSSVNQDSLNTLSLGTSITLAWAGSIGSDPGSRRLKKRDAGLYSEAALTFAYPAVSLDASNDVSNISCSSGSITGSLSDSAYAFAQKEWTNAATILFLTSADGCGADNANEIVKASSVTFSDDDNTFTVQGSSTEYKDVVTHMNVQYGSVGANQRIKRSVDKRDMFESARMYRRLDVSANPSYTLSWEAYLEDSDLLGPAANAPWPNSALLEQWGTEGGTPDDSWEEGQVASPTGHHKRSNVTSLAVRQEGGGDGPTYGLSLYCIHCGFGGSATLYGNFDADVEFTSVTVNTAQAGFKLDMQAGLVLGMQAFVDYQKDWAKTLASQQLSGFSLEGLITISPFVQVSVAASTEISASGQLEIGATMNWNAVNAMIDLVDSSNSQTTWGSPTFTPVASAEGELQISAQLALPVSIGVNLQAFEGLWSGSASVEDTPSLTFEGEFEISASVNANGQIETNVNNGNGCYGISWDINFENTLTATFEGDLLGSDTFDLIAPINLPVASGCIGYVSDGSQTGEGLGGENQNSSSPPSPTSTTPTAQTTTTRQTTTLATTTTKKATTTSPAKSTKTTSKKLAPVKGSSPTTKSPVKVSSPTIKSPVKGSSPTAKSPVQHIHRARHQ